jgi:hypothetical protein
VDQLLRQELRQAEKDGNYQRLYFLLQRAGQFDEARRLLLDHPIQVECTVQYRYRIRWYTGNYNDFSEKPDDVTDYKLDALIEKFVEERVGASQIRFIERNPVMHLMGAEIELTSFSFRQEQLPTFIIGEEEKQSIKNRIRAHSRYLQGASAQELEDAREADERDAEAARRKMEDQRRSAAVQERRNRLQADFQRDSAQHYIEVCDLWAKYRDLPRPQFARMIGGYSLRGILFHLKDLQEQGNEQVTTGVINQAWQDFEPKRFNIYQRSWQG